MILLHNHDIIKYANYFKVYIGIRQVDMQFNKVYAYYLFIFYMKMKLLINT